MTLDANAKEEHRLMMRQLQENDGPFVDEEGNAINYFVNRSTNASAESLNAKIKHFRAQLRGIIDRKFFLFRLMKIYA